MPRAIWSGAISFGLVNIPVKLYSAVSRKTVRFNQLDGSDNSRVRQKRINETTGEEVPYENLVKGYEIGPERYVVITPDELDSVQPEKSRTIDIEDFVELDQIDPMFFDHTYYLAPGTGAGKAYALLLKAMEETGRVAIARVVIRSKENLVAIRPRDGVLAMETMLFSDEVVSPDSLDEVAGRQGREDHQARGGHGAPADRLAGLRLRARQVPRRVPRPGARDDRAQGRGRGDRHRGAQRGARGGARPDGRAGGQHRLVEEAERSPRRSSSAKSSNGSGSAKKKKTAAKK